MKRKNELIRIAEGYEPADSRFLEEGTDTGFDENDPEQLCEECKAVGFCRMMHPEKFAFELERLKGIEDGNLLK